VQAELGPAGSGQVILLSNAPPSFSYPPVPAPTQIAGTATTLGTTELTVPLNSVSVQILPPPGPGPATLSDLDSPAPAGTGQPALAQGQTVLENKINGLFVRINTNAGQSLDTLDVTARFHDTDITYVIEENLVLTGEPGGPSGPVGRPSARLQIDPGVIVKLSSARIEVGPGANLVAEGDQNHQVVLTSLYDDTVGAGARSSPMPTSKARGKRPPATGAAFISGPRPRPASTTA
jgi:hypothetical protein